MMGPTRKRRGRKKNCVIHRKTEKVMEDPGLVLPNTDFCTPIPIVNYSALEEDCRRPCSVVLEQLNFEVIEKFTGFHDWNEYYRYVETQKKLAKHQVRDVQRFDISLFAKYKRSREKFLHKNVHRSSTEHRDFDSFSSEEYDNFSNGEYSMDEYRPSIKESRRLKKKKHAYEEDSDWNPNPEWNTSVPKQLGKVKKSLRVNTRRKRIESDSSSSNDNFSSPSYSDDETVRPSEEMMSPLEDVYDVNQITLTRKPMLSKKSNIKPIKTAATKQSSAHFLDSDLITQIIQEMDECKNTNRTQVGKVNNKYNQINNTDNSYRSVNFKSPSVRKKRNFQSIRITDKGLTPSLNSVQELVNEMVHTVCSNNPDKTSAFKIPEKMCKWCDAIFPLGNPMDILCPVCRDVLKLSSRKSSSTKIRKARVPKNGNILSKMKKKAMQYLPKYDQQRLLYKDKPSVEKSYNHCKSSSITKDIGSGASVSEFTSFERQNPAEESPSPKKKKKQDKISDESLKKKKVKKKLGRKSEDSTEPLKIKKISNPKPGQKVIGKNEKYVSVEKGLFLMTFPEPDHELDMSKSSPLKKESSKSNQVTAEEKPKRLATSLTNNDTKSAVQNVQVGKYLFPPVPTVLVANYAATNGDYYLSSLYYQSETTQSRNLTLQNGGDAFDNVKSILPSMPSFDQLSAPSVVDVAQNFSAMFPTEQKLGITNTVVENTTLLNNSPALSIGSDSSIIAAQHVMDMLVNKSLEPSVYNAEMVPELNFAEMLNDSEIQESIQSGDIYNCFENSDFNINDPFPNTEIVAQDDSLTKMDSVSTNSISKDASSIPSAVAKSTNEGEQPTKKQDSKSSEHNHNTSQSSSDPKNSRVDHSSEQLETDHLLSEDLLKAACAELDAICILGVVDLDQNPKWSLGGKIVMNKKQTEELQNVPSPDKVTELKLQHLIANGRTLQLASTLLNRFGSFAKLADRFLWRAKLLEIKKEKFLEHETQSSCQFAQAQPKQQSFVNAEQPQSHIDKIQTQIQSMQGVSTLPGNSSQAGNAYSFPVPSISPFSTSASAAMSVTPSNELLNESRETPSRGSGPRTPARPESAISQTEDVPLTPLQIKKEKQESSNPSPSQWAYSKNTPSPQLPVSSPIMSQIPPPPPLNNQMPAYNVPALNNQIMNMVNSQRLRNITPNMIGTNNSPQVSNLMRGVGPPNVTIPYNTNQSLSKVLLNFAAKQPPIPNVSQNVNSNNQNVIFRNNPLYNVQQVYIPGISNQSPRFNSQTSSQATGQLILRPQNSVSNMCGGVLVNNMGQTTYSFQNTSASNSQQVNTAGVYQQTILPNSSQAVPNTSFLMQNNQPRESVPTTEMFCALCNKVATLRCKQCAKVAYCDTACAKTYWQAKHKKECKSMLG